RVVPLLPPHRGHAPGPDPRRRHPRRDPGQRRGDRQSPRHPDGRSLMLELEKVNTFRGPAPVLRAVRPRVGDAEAVCLVGRNGAGKTTTIDSIMGLLPVRSGRITLDGRDISRLPAHRRALLGIGYSPGGAGVCPDLTVAENFV